MIVSGGENVFPREVEDLLDGHRGGRRGGGRRRRRRAVRPAPEGRRRPARASSPPRTRLEASYVKTEPRAPTRCPRDVDVRRRAAAQRRPARSSSATYCTRHGAALVLLWRSAPRHMARPRREGRSLLDLEVRSIERNCAGAANTAARRTRVVTPALDPAAPRPLRTRYRPGGWALRMRGRGVGGGAVHALPGRARDPDLPGRLVRRSISRGQANAELLSPTTWASSWRWRPGRATRSHWRCRPRSSAVRTASRPVPQVRREAQREDPDHAHEGGAQTRAGRSSPSSSSDFGSHRPEGDASRKFHRTTKGSFVWTEVKLLDLSSGEVVQSIYDNKQTDFTVTQARTGKPIAIKDATGNISRCKQASF